MEDRSQPRTVLLTADRFSPWNGRRPGEPDHIWADMPLEVDLPLLVYRGEEISRGPDEYRFGTVEETEYRSSDRWMVPVVVFQSLLLAARFGPRLLLGLRPLLIVSRLKRALLRQSSPGAVTRWHRAVIGLTRHLRTARPDVLVCHGEFDSWGIAVVWACRRAGVACVAHQHYAMPADSPQYRRVERLGRFAPDGLLCVSRFQQELWKSLPIPVGFGGSRRPIWNLHHRSGSKCDRMGQLLIVPSVGDTAQIQREIADRPTERFHVRPHPGRRDGWSLPNVRVHEENLIELLDQFDAVVTSSPSPTVSLTAARKPFIKMRGLQPDGTCTCGERQTFTRLDQVLDSLANGVPLQDLTSLGCEHNLTASLGREEYRKCIEDLLPAGPERRLKHLVREVHGSGVPGPAGLLRMATQKSTESPIGDGHQGLVLIDNNLNKVKHAERVFGERLCHIRMTPFALRFRDRLLLVLSAALPKHSRWILASSTIAKTIARNIGGSARVALYNPYLLVHYAVARELTIESTYHLSPEYPRIENTTFAYACPATHEILGYRRAVRRDAFQEMRFEEDHQVLRFYLSQAEATGGLPEERALVQLARWASRNCPVQIEIFLHYLDRGRSFADLKRLGIPAELHRHVRRDASLQTLSRFQLSMSATSTIGYDLVSADISHFILVDMERAPRKNYDSEIWRNLKVWRENRVEVLPFGLPERVVFERIREADPIGFKRTLSGWRP